MSTGQAVLLPWLYDDRTSKFIPLSVTHTGPVPSQHGIGAPLWIAAHARTLFVTTDHNYSWDAAQQNEVT